MMEPFVCSKIAHPKLAGMRVSLIKVYIKVKHQEINAEDFAQRDRVFK